MTSPFAINQALLPLGSPYDPVSAQMDPILRPAYNAASNAFKMPGLRIPIAQAPVSEPSAPPAMPMANATPQDQAALQAMLNQGGGMNSPLSLIQNLQGLGTGAPYGGAIASALRQYAQAGQNIAGQKAAAAGKMVKAYENILPKPGEKSTAQQVGEIGDNYQKEHAAATAALKKTTDDFMGAKIDPLNYVKSLPIWSKALFALSAGMSSFGQSFHGGPNIPMELLKEGINNDILAQTKNREGLRALMENARANLGEVGKKATTVQQIISATQAARFNEAKMATDVIRAQMEANPDPRSNVLAQEARQASAMFAAETDKALSGLALQNLGLHQHLITSLISNPLLWRQMQWRNQGILGVPTSDEAFNKINQANAHRLEAKATLSKMQELFKQGGIQSRSGSYPEAMMAHSANLRRSVLGLLGAVDLPKKDKEALLESLSYSDPTGRNWKNFLGLGKQSTSELVGSQLTRTGETIDRAWQTLLKAHGAYDANMPMNTQAPTDTPANMGLGPGAQ